MPTTDEKFDEMMRELEGKTKIGLCYDCGKETEITCTERMYAPYWMCKECMRKYSEWCHEVMKAQWEAEEQEERLRQDDICPEVN